jgi:hypothetical protein
MAAMQVRTWADHLEPIGYGLAIPVRSTDSMNREYPLEPPGTGYSYWWTAEDGSFFFYPFGRASGFYDGASYTPQAYHFMWTLDYPDPSVPPYTTQRVFALFYMDDQDMSQMIGETVTTTGTPVIIAASAQLAPGPGIPGGQPIASTVGLITSVGKLTAVT